MAYPVQDKLAPVFVGEVVCLREGVALAVAIGACGLGGQEGRGGDEVWAFSAVVLGGGFGVLEDFRLEERVIGF